MPARTAFVTGGSGYIGRNLIRRLIDDDTVVRALARSDTAAKVVGALGALPVTGDLADADALAFGMTGADVVFHVAGLTAEWGEPELFHATHVEGTRAVIREARQAGVPVVVHVSTNSVMLDGSPVAGVDESAAIPDRPLPLYPATKAAGEQIALAASGHDMRVVAVRPCLVWGNDDTTLLPRFVEMIETGEFWWLGRGRHLVSTSHVDNVVEGLVLAERHGIGGRAYYVTDGDPVELRSFLTRLVDTQGVSPPRRSIPSRLAYMAGAACEMLWTKLPLRGSPPVTRYVVNEAGMPNHVDDRLARAELGYRPLITIDQGIARLASRNTA